MATGYSKQFNSQPNDKIDADLFNSEYQLLDDAFDETLGHIHDGNFANGGYIPLISDLDNMNTIQILSDPDNKIVITNNFNNTKVETLTIQSTGIIPSALTLDLGTYSNRFKELNVNEAGNLGSLRVGTTNPSNPSDIDNLIQITDILDEPDLVSDSNTALATQQSLKTYIDTEVGARGIFVQTMNMYRDSSQAITGALAPFMTLVMSNIRVGSRIHISGFVTGSLVSSASGVIGQILLRIFRDGAEITPQDLIVVENVSGDQNSISKGTIGFSFIDEGVTLNEHTYRISTRAVNFATSQANALAGSMILMEEIV